MTQPAHPYWEHQFLQTAGLPTDTGNVLFLRDWWVYKSARGDHNPLDLSQREPGSTRSQRLQNGKWAQNYTDTQSAVNAFADQLNLTDYPDLRRALASGDPYGYGDHSGVALNLQRWGSVDFQAEYNKREGAATVGGGGGRGRPTSKNVGAAWSRLMRTLARDGHRTIVELHKATADLNRIGRRLRRA